MHVSPEPRQVLLAIQPRNLCNLISISDGTQLALKILEHFTGPRPNTENSPYMMASWHLIRKADIANRMDPHQV